MIRFLKNIVTIKKWVLLIIVLLFCNQTFAGTVVVPRNTNVKIKIKTPYDSKQIHRYVEDYCSGQRNSVELEAVVAEDLVVNGSIVASKGNGATIKIEDSYKAKTFGRGGYIKVNGAEFVDNNGYVHNLDIEKIFRGDNDILLTRAIIFNRGEQAKISTSDIMDSATTTPFNYYVSKSNLNPKAEIASARAISNICLKFEYTIDENVHATPTIEYFYIDLTSKKIYTMNKKPVTKILKFTDDAISFVTVVDSANYNKDWAIVTTYDVDRNSGALFVSQKFLPKRFIVINKIDLILSGKTDRVYSNGTGTVSIVEKSKKVF